MSRALKRKNLGLGAMIGFSALLHLALYFFLAYFQLTGVQLKEEPVYYVEITNLPVANPQTGSPASGGGESPRALPAPAPKPRQVQAPPAARTGKAPSASMPAKAGKTLPKSQGNDTDFDERLKRLQKDIEERRQASALEALRKKLTSKGKGAGLAGIPSGAGSEAGSDYANYIQSRLKDALAATIAYQSRNPEVVLRLTIDRNGRLTRSVIERTTRDRIFEEAVLRALSIAEKTFPPPPNGAEFEHGFIFRPQGVGKK